LASTNEISSYTEVYRFDFPAIDTYPSGDFSDTESISKIASETLALKEVVSDIAYSATNIITELAGKQPTIEDGDLTIVKTSGLQTALDDKYEKNRRFYKW